MQAKQVMSICSTAVLVLFAIQGLALAKKQSPKSVACFRTVTSGSGPSFMKICVSNHGNLMQFESPKGYQHIGSEGYVVCSDSASPSHGYDAGFVESGFSASTTSGWTVTRTTRDGIFQLKQVFSYDTAKKDVTITMTLTNLTNAPVDGVSLSRYFDGDVSNSSDGDIYNHTWDSVDSHDGFGGDGHGLMLTALSFATDHGSFPYGYNVAIEDYADWSRQTCYPEAGRLGPTDPGDYVGRVTYGLGTIDAGASKTVKFLYRRF